MSIPRDQPYPLLNQLIGGWFHQDFDVEGETIEDVVAAYKAATSPEEVRGVKAEIRRFVEQAGDNIDDRFEMLFHHDSNPPGWGLTTRAWLDRIHDAL
jgi:hypothetical protein